MFNASEQNPGAFSTSVWFFRQVRTQQSLSGTDQNNRLSEVLLARFQVNSESDSTLNQLQKVNQKWYDLYSMNKRILQAWSALFTTFFEYFWFLIVPKYVQCETKPNSKRSTRKQTNVKAPSETLYNIKHLQI